MGHLINLKGVAAKETDCDFFYKSSEIMPILEKGIAATSAGSNGAMNVWYDDDRKLRGEMMRYLRTEEERVFESVSEMKKWALHTLKKIGSPKPE